MYIYVQKNSTSLDVSMNSVKERDKGYKRKSYLNRSRHVETAADRSNEGKEFINECKTSLLISNCNNKREIKLLNCSRESKVLNYNILVFSFVFLKF